MSTEYSQNFITPEIDASSPPAEDASLKTVAQLIDFNAQHNPNYLFCLQAEKPLDGVKDPPLLRITHKSFQAMILSCQTWVQEHIKEIQLPMKDERGDIVKGAPIGILLDSDIGLLVYLFALVGLGVPVLLLSTRLSPSAVQSLLAKTGCLAVLASPRHIGAAKEALTLYQANEECPVIYAQAPYRTFTKPASTTRQRSLLDDTSGYDFQHAHGHKGRISQSSRYHDQQLLPETPRIATKYHYGADTDRNVFILHSSGTTGLPKAIPQAHRYLMSLAPLSSFESDSPDYIVNEQKMAFSTLPLFHCFGLMAPMLSLSIGKPFAIPPSGFIPTALSTVQFISMVTASTLMVVPSILQDIAELPNDQGIDALKSLQYIACGGGALSPSVGEKLVSAGVKIINGFGGTEVGSLGILQPPGPDRDWKCFRLRQDLGCTVKEIAPAQPGEIPHYRISVRPPGWTEDFEISDFFVTSAKRPGQDFQPIARADDVLVLKTGEKVQPHVLETMLSDRADIRAALAFGDGQFEIGVMIEPAQLIPLLRIEEFKDAVWPTIIEAGKVMDAHAQVSCRDAVVVLGPGQKIPRSAKGSVLRKTAYEQFREEIEAVYTQLETPSTTDVERTTNQAQFHVQPPSPAAAQVNGITNTHHANGCAISAVLQGEIDRIVTDIAAHLWQPDDQISAQGGASQGTPDFLSGDIEQKLLEHVQAHIWKPHAGLLNNTEDLFELGMDSLQAVQLRRFLIAQLSQSKHPRAAAINVPKDILYTHSSIAKIAAYLLNRTIPPRLKQEENVFQSLLEQYVSHSRLSNPVIIPSGSTILLTGGTGALGCHLISQLASGTPIDRIICLNRINIDGANPYARQFKSSKEKGAHIPLSIIDKVEILETNTSLPYLGLAQPVYWGLASAVTHIIHNAWPVDFKRTITSFESQFSIMANLLDLARDAGSRPQFMFVSSIAVVAQYSNNTSGNENPIIVPEAPFQPHWPAPTMGYGQAKLVCEKMLEHAVDDGIVDGVITRCGQISGSMSNGYWNSSEYFPTLIRNSQRVGALPDLDGTLSWLPLEATASTLVDLLHVPSKRLVYHVENPVRQPWTSVLTPLSMDLSLPMTSFKDWLERVERLEGDTTTLYDFFERDFRHVGLGRLYMDTTGAKSDSVSLSGAGIVREEVVRRYAVRCVG